MKKSQQTLRKAIKKALRLFLVLLAFVLILPFAVAGLLLIPSVQNQAVDWAAEYASTYLGSEIKIGGLYLEPFTTVRLDEVLIRDFHADTMIYAGAVHVQLSGFNADSSFLDLSEVEVHHGFFHLKIYEGDSLTNIEHFANAFPASDDTSSSKPFTINSNRLLLDSLRFAFDDLNAPDSSSNSINFQHINVAGLSGELTEISVINDSIQAKIQGLQLSEKSGFMIRHFTANASVTSNRIICDSMSLVTNTAEVHGRYEMQSNGWTNYSEFIEKVRLEADLYNTDVHFDDIGYFTPQLRGLLTQMDFTGQVSGTIDNLKANVRELKFANSGELAGKVKIKGLPNIENTFIDADLRRLYATFSDAEQINLPGPDGYVKLTFPDEMQSLEYVFFTGKFVGFVNDFVTFGNIKTALGTIDADVNMKTTEGFQYSGHVFSNGFKIGRLLDLESTIQDVSFDLDVLGHGVEVNTLDVKATGSIRKFAVLEYTYKNLEVDGEFKNKVFTGNVSANDTNIKLDFAGMIDLSHTIPQISCQTKVERLHLANLNLVPADTHGVFSGNIDLQMTGNSLETLHGTLKVLKPRYTSSLGTIALDTISLQDELLSDGHDIRLTSDIVRVHIKGQTSLFDLPYALTKVSHKYAPSFTPKLGWQDHDTTQQFQFEIEVENDRELIDFVSKDLKFNTPVSLAGSVSTFDDVFVLRSDSLDWSYKNIAFEGNTISIKPDNEHLIITSNTQKFSLSEEFFLENLHFGGDLRHDSLVTALSWSNLTNQADSGGLDMVLYRGTYYPWNATLNHLEVRVAGVEWKSRSMASLNADSGKVVIRDLDLHSTTGYITCNGVLDRKASEHLYFNVGDFDLNYLSNFGIMQQSIKGTFNGQVDIYDQASSIVVDADLEIDSLEVDDLEIGRIVGTTQYDNDANRVSVNVDLEYMGNESMRIVGDYYPLRKTEQLELEAAFSDFQLRNLEPFVAENVTNLEGSANGSISVTGNLNDPELTGGLVVTDAYGMINYLNTAYDIPKAEVSVTKTEIEIKNTEVVDIEGHMAVVSVLVTHDKFKDFTYDVKVNATEFQCLNTTLADNEDYYGQAVVSGDVNISGRVGYTRIVVDASTDRGTKISIPLSSGGEVNQFDYIRFVEAKSFKQEHTEKALEEELNGLELDFRLSVDNDAEVQIIFDEKVGDIIKVRGEGDMLMQIDNLGKFNMYGDYVISEGDYLFTLQNIVNKRFSVSPGSRIVWNGDPEKAQVDITAVYRLKASPAVMVQSMAGVEDGTEDYYAQRLPVNVKLYMDGLMTSPDISFGVNLPSLPESDQANQLLNPAVASQEQITSQAFSLLIANNFSSGSGNVALGGAGQNTGYEMLSNQLSNWASQYSDKFDVGVSYREGDAEQNLGNQTELSLSTDLFNQRVSVEVNGSVQGDANSGEASEQETSNLAGEFNVEYKINKDGSLKARVYNEANNYTNMNQSPYTQGVGLFYRREFDTWGEFFKNLFKKKKPKTEKVSEEEKPSED